MDKHIVQAIVVAMFLMMLCVFGVYYINIHKNEIDNSSLSELITVINATSSTTDTTVSTTTTTDITSTTDVTSTTEDTTTTLEDTTTMESTTYTTTIITTTMQSTMTQPEIIKSDTIANIVTNISNITTTTTAVQENNDTWMVKYIDYLNGGEKPHKIKIGDFKATYYTPIDGQQPENVLGGSGRILNDCGKKDFIYKGSVACRSVFELYGYNYNGRTLVYLNFPEGYRDYNGIYSVDDCCGGYGIIDMFFDYDQNSPFSGGIGAVNGVEIYVLL